MKNLLLLFFTVIFIAPDDYKTFFKKGIDKLLNGRENEALAYFLDSEKQFQCPKTSYYIAVCYYNLKKFDDAVKYAEQANNTTEQLPKKPYQEKINLMLSHKITQGVGYNRKVYNGTLKDRTDYRTNINTSKNSNGQFVDKRDLKEAMAKKKDDSLPNIFFKIVITNDSI